MMNHLIDTACAMPNIPMPNIPNSADNNSTTNSQSEMRTISPSSSQSTTLSDDDHTPTPFARKSSSGSSSSFHDKTTPPKTSSWLSRQISAAYEEHSSIIGSLRKELDTAKSRERALIQEFSARFRQMNEAVPGTNKTVGELYIPSSTVLHDATAGNTTPLSVGKNTGPVYDDDMPMDELADAARKERHIRDFEQVEQRRTMQLFQEQSDREMEKLRKENEVRIKKIEGALKEKVEEIDRLKKEMQRFTEGKGMNRKMQRSRSRSPAPPLSPKSSSPRPSSTPTHSPMSMEYNNSSSNLSMDEKFPGWSPKLDFPSLPRSPSTRAMAQMTRDKNITPISRLRIGKSQSPNNTNKAFDMMDNSQMAVDGSAMDQEMGLDGGGNNVSHLVTIPMGESQETIPSPPSSMDNQEFHASINSPNNNNNNSPPPPPPPPPPLETRSQVIQKLIKTTEILFQEKSPSLMAKESMEQLDEDERVFVERVKAIFHSSQKRQRDVLTVYKKELETARRELKEKVKDTKRADEDQSVTKSRIEELESQLRSAQSSLKTTEELQKLCQMLQAEKETSQQKQDTLLQNLRELEKHRDNWMMEKEGRNSEEEEEEKEDSDSVQAIQRVLADMSSEREKVVGEMQKKIDTLTTQNDQLKKQLDPDADANSENTITTITEREMSDLVEQAKKSDDYEVELSKVWEDLEQANKENTNVKKSLKESKETISNLKKKIQVLTKSSKKKSGAMENEYKDNLSLVKREKEKALEELLRLKITKSDGSKDNDELCKNVKDLENKVDKLTKELKEKTDLVETKEKDLSKLQKEYDLMADTSKAATTKSEDLDKKVIELNGLIEGYKSQASATEEILKTAKSAHAREQKLEDELGELRTLLDKTMKGKVSLRNEIREKSDALMTLTKQSETREKELLAEIAVLKKNYTSLQNSAAGLEAGHLCSKLKETEIQLKSILDCNQMVSRNLSEQLALHNQLRLFSDDDGKDNLDELSILVQSSLKSIRNASDYASSSGSPKSVLDTNTFDYKVAPSPTSNELLGSQLKALRVENEKMRVDLEEMRNERDQDLVLLNTEMNRVKEEYTINVELLSNKEKELQLLRDSLQESSLGYISDDDTDTECDNDDAPPDIGSMAMNAIVASRDASVDNSKQVQAELIRAKEEAEERARRNEESLANAKMIIASLEKSNKKMTQDLRSRLHDSNSAIVSLLEQTGKYEKESEMFKAKIETIQQAKENIEKDLMEYKKMEISSKETPISLDNEIEI